MTALLWLQAAALLVWPTALFEWFATVYLMWAIAVTQLSVKAILLWMTHSALYMDNTSAVDCFSDVPFQCLHDSFIAKDDTHILYIVSDIVLCHDLLLYIRIVLVFLYIAFVNKLYYCMLYNLLCAT